MTTLTERLHNKSKRKIKKDANLLNQDNDKKKTNSSVDIIKIVDMIDYELIHTRKYKLSQLREICDHYELKKVGNKDVLIARIYDYLKHSLYVIKIQKVMRGYFTREYLYSSGPAMRDRSICVNDTDFATLDPIREIPYNQFYSFKACDDNVYGCDIISLYNLLYNSHNVYSREKLPLNPYTRAVLPTTLATEFKRYIRLAKVVKVDFTITNEESEIDPQKRLEMRIIELFQYINELGNYADSRWFSSLPRFMLVLFIREMYDIWTYRAQLSPQTMVEIVPPHGNPFAGLSLHLAQNQSEESLRNSALRIIEYLVKSGNSNENRALGAYYVLAALTLVSEEARNSLPWLFQSVAH